MPKMRQYPMVTWLDVVALMCLCASSHAGQFYGGSISQSLTILDNGETWAKVELLTAWELGKGPCGPDCTKADIGRSTATSRLQQIQQFGQKLFFGNFSSDFEVNGKTKYKNLNDEFESNYSESVLAVNVRAQWEMDLATFSFKLEDDVGSQDFNYDGTFWRDLSIQGNNLRWHMQTRVHIGRRSDTNKPNNIPQVLSRPFYRIPLNETSQIQLPTIDADGDTVGCGDAMFIERGGLSMLQLPGVTVKSDPPKGCFINIDTSYPDYKDDTWIAIPITIRDNPKQTISMGNVSKKESDALSSTAVQFVVNVRTVVFTPEFVSPTKESGHEYFLFAESAWTLTLYAEASENMTIEEFTATTRSGEEFQISAPQDDRRRDGVRYVLVTWSPGSGDVGRHIACFTAVDISGVESAKERCYYLNVVAQRFNNTSSTPKNGMTFVDIPSQQDLIHCPVDSTCILPVFVRSSLQVVAVTISESFSDSANLGNVTLVTHSGEQVYKADLSFTHTVNEEVRICFYAVDTVGSRSETVCVKSVIDAPDPCLSSPCAYSQPCESGNTPGSYSCICQYGYIGKNCEIRIDFCKPSPCVHGQCFSIPGKGYKCLCKENSVQNGYTGVNCETNIDECESVTCNDHGICIDGVKSHTCDCYSRYNGTDCRNDTCDGEDSSMSTCPIAGCAGDPCGENGVCVTGGICKCKRGWAGVFCSTERDPSTLVTEVEIVAPTPTDGSSIVCYLSGTSIVNSCQIAAFALTKDGSPPTFELSTRSSPSLLGTSSFSSVSPDNTIGGMKNVFTSTLTVAGSIKNGTAYSYICLTAKSNAGEVTRCYSIRLIEDPTLISGTKEANQKNAPKHFIPPTPVGNSRFTCMLGETCYINLYTNKLTDCPSEKIITPTEDVLVAPPEDSGTGNCSTEAWFTFNTAGVKDVCFATGLTNAQERCYKIDVYTSGHEPCSTSPCRNDGVCLQTVYGEFKCECSTQHEGKYCEKGPCLTNVCGAQATCLASNDTVTCICPVGYSGDKCQTAPGNVNGSQNTNGGAVFIPSIPRDIYCDKNRPCSVDFLIARPTTSSNEPRVLQGYISPELVVQSIELKERLWNGVSTGSYEVSVPFKPKAEGEYSLCMQTLDNNRVNKDEVCVTVHVSSGTATLYPYVDRPQFVSPSPPDGSVVHCDVNTQCHMVYHVVSGASHETECIDVILSDKGGLENVFPYSNCDACNGNCSIDVAFIPDNAAGASNPIQICLTLGLQGTDTVGEQRCFKIVTDIPANPSGTNGCRTLHCQNGGFCDGHDPSAPKCFCAQGYTGTDCGDVTVPPALGTGTQQKSFLGDSATPSEVRCGVQCSCPIPLHIMSQTTTPVVTLGSVDGRLEVVLPNMQRSGTTQQYTGVVTVKPRSAGKLNICLQMIENYMYTYLTQNVKDELCFIINTEGVCPDEADKNRPYFLASTLPGDSAVLCEKGQTCHIGLHISKGDLFGHPNKCPTLRETGVETVTGLHVFLPTHGASECTSDVSFSPSTSLADGSQAHICLKLTMPGKQGEERCFVFHIVNNVTAQVPRPCKDVTCMNTGVCVPTPNLLAFTCACQKGFSGTNCSISIPEQTLRPGITNPLGSGTDAPNISPVDALPKETACEVNKECRILVPFTGDKTKPPVPGYTDPGLEILNTTVITPDPFNHPFQHVLVTTVTAHEMRPHSICVQTTTDGTKTGSNVDETCSLVNVQAPGTGTSTPDSTKATFNSNYASSNSTFQCETGTSCHLTVITEKPPGSIDCPQVRQCEAGVIGLYMFPTIQFFGHCVTDISYQTGSTGTTSKLCISAGPDGETREYTIEAVNNTAPKGCQKLQCLNGGFCDGHDAASPVCICTQGYFGTTCNTKITPPHNTPTIVNKPSTTPDAPQFNHGSAQPQEIVCDVNKTCRVTVPYTGNPAKPPILGFTDPDIATNKFEVLTPDPLNHPDQHVLVTTVTAPSGQHQMCFQTTSDGTKTGVNVDEICSTIHGLTPDPQKPALDPNKPAFGPASPQSNSSLQCQKDSQCHFHITTIKPASGKCPQVAPCGSRTLSSHAFTTKQSQDGSACVTDVVLQTGGVGEQNMCVKAGPLGEERHYTVSVKDPSMPLGCQKLHCEHGGFCDGHNQTNPVCICPRGFIDTECKTEITTPQNTPTIVNKPSTTPDAPQFNYGSAQPHEIVCDVNKTCRVTVPYTGNQTNPPILGFIDPDIYTNKSEVLTPDPSHPDQHVLVTTVTVPTGQHQMCFQTTSDGTKTGVNVDEICSTIHGLTPDPNKPALDPTKAAFGPDSPQSNSSFQCQKDSECYFQITTTKPATGKCPQVASCGSGTFSSHAFTTKQSQDGSACVTDIVLQTGGVGEQNMCVKAGPLGEERHYTVSVKDPSMPLGCQKLHCEHGGFCDGHNRTNPVCACPLGYSGTECKTEITTPQNTPTIVNKPSSTPDAPQFNHGSAQPQEIVCDVNKTCRVTVPYTGDQTKPPILGFTDPGIDTNKTEVLTPDPSHPDQHVLVTTVTVPSGQHKICFQTTNDGTQTGVNVDEICATIHGSTLNPSQPALDPNKPAFGPESPQSNSSLQCHKNSQCHVHITTTKPASGTCPQVVACGSGTFFSHAFSTKQSQDGSACVTDVLLQTGGVGEQTLCVKAGPLGEERHYTVSVKDPTKSLGCQKLHCEHGGFCDGHDQTNPVCICPRGYSGPECKTVNQPAASLPGVVNASSTTTNAPHYIPGGAIPKVTTCVKSKPCPVSIPFIGNATHPPVPGFLTPGLNIVGTTVVTPDPVNHPDHHVLITNVESVTGNIGPYIACFQTTSDGTMHGENVDEICSSVNITAGSNVQSPNPSKPAFSSSAPPASSTFLCQPNTDCQQTFITDQTSPGQCAQMKQCQTATPNLHVFETKPINGQCVTELGYKTDTTDGTNDICLMAGKEGEQRHYTIETKQTTSFGPCQRLHCKNNGTCMYKTDTHAECTCIAGFKGTDCSQGNLCKANTCKNSGTCHEGQNTFTCTCAPGFTGATCNKDIDDCASNPCQHGTCVDGLQKYTCNCLTGYNGTNCEHNIDECAGTPCQNGGSCVDGVNNYTCNCKPGFNGPQCQNDINDCAGIKCSNKGTCQDGANSYKCTCNPGYTGHNCETDIDECASAPCKNGATCNNGENAYTCTCPTGFNGDDCESNIDECAGVTCQAGGTCIDGAGDYTCKCALGHVGRHCETNDPNAVDECASMPCKNGATCVDGMNKYTCICPRGFTDPTCETNINECSPSPCLHGGTCVDGIAQYTCQCSTGYTGVNCQTNIDDCSPNPCLNGASCVDGVNGYSCTCAPGFEGNNCDINTDDCSSNPCQHSGTCQDGVASYTCQCTPGFEGHDCEINHDDCTPNPCSAGSTCNDLVHAYKCACPDGITGRTCTQDIDECASMPCQNGASCVNGNNKYTCQCPAGFEGANCETNTNECAAHPCQNGGICVDGIGSYTCTCDQTHEGQNCEALKDGDDCLHNNCENGGTCLDGVHTYTCRCPPGTTGNHCQTEIDECHSNPCVHGTCHDQRNGFTCNCEPGFTGDHCHIDINECQSAPCQNGGTCEDQVNSYTCKCVTGFNGINCENNIDDCANHPCIFGACRDGINSFTCDCVPGFTGRKCETNINECLSSPCRNQGTCNDGLNKFTCACVPGFTGTRCEINIDECGSSPCQNGGICSDRVNGFICSCLLGWTGSNCQTNIDDCSPNPCQNSGICTDGINSYTCTCSLQWEGTHCQTASIINECDSNPCQNNATCHDGTNQYTCSCLPGFTGVNCETETDECSPAPCLNGGTCNDGLNMYTCTCLPGYKGSRCEIDINECESSPCQNGATCDDGVNKYTCRCIPGYTGINCNIEIDECASQPCQNGAECVNQLNAYKCNCRPGYQGAACQIDINECSSNPCKNGGRCINLENKFVCNCASGFEGTLCEGKSIINECVDPGQNQCANGGTCVDDVNKYTCVCSPGHTGATCSQVIDHCSSDPCSNGGTCASSPSGFTCNCRPGFTGQDCTKKSLSTLHNVSPNPMNGETAGPVFTEFVIPEVIRCAVNKNCPIILPVASKPGELPLVQNGHHSSGLVAREPITTQRSEPCDVQFCYFESLISVTPTVLGTFKYCVQTVNANTGINADELCYKIKSFSEPSNSVQSSFHQPPTLPNHSVMACPSGNTCQYTIETEKPCKADLAPETPSNSIHVSAPVQSGNACTYKVLVSPDPTQNGQNISMCFKLSPTDRHCTEIKVAEKTDIASRTGPCSTLHCKKGFCDSSQEMPTCICSPGYAGATCENAVSCSVGSIPGRITCNDPTDCNIGFVVTGSTRPTVNILGSSLRPMLTQTGKNYFVNIKIPSPVPQAPVCINVNVAGACNTSGCVEIKQGQGPGQPTGDGELSSSTPSLNCSTDSTATTCHPMVITSKPIHNTTTGQVTCPTLSVGTGTTMQNVHLFENKLLNDRCLATVVATPDPALSGQSKLCISAETSIEKCMDVTKNEEDCDQTTAGNHARSQVKMGLVSCKCVVNQKVVKVVKRKPVPTSQKVYKAAGMGAGGMAGTMTIAVVIYLVISKLKKTSTPPERSRSPRTGHGSGKVRPRSRFHDSF